MATKQIPKDLLDRAIAETKEYYRSADLQILNKLSDTTHEIEYATGIAWFALENLLGGILCSIGCKPDATNEDVYAILRLLGWEMSK